MEMGEMEMQARKRWRLGNGREEAKIDDDDEDGEGVAGSAGVEKEDDKARVLAAWHSSRIFRVSRATGGKDRHSKVLTAKGLRDRRVRLSVSTAIQFYDLQDRLGYDQPSKAVEWLIKAAADAIAELPSLDGAFPTSPNQLRCIERRFQETGKETDFPFLQQQQQHQLQLPHQHQHQQQQQLASLSKSACSSTSETSKGSSGLSLSRSEIRVKARERARKRTAKEKEKEKETNLPQQQHNPNPNSETSFTELLSGCNGGGTANQNPDAHFIPKQFRHFPSMDYFAPSTQLASSGFSSQIHFGNPPVSTLPLGVSAVNAGDQPELQQFTFLQDHFTGSDQTLNFSISSSLAGFNRGTLQSNSPSSPLLPHLQRFSSPVGEGSPNVPFFLGTAAATAALESQFSAGSDGRLQLYYGDGCRHSDRKGKGKS